VCPRSIQDYSLACPHTRRIVDGGVLITFDFLTGFAFEYQELNTHLNVVARYLLVVTFCVDFSTPHLARQSVYTVPIEDPANGGIRNSHLMATGHVPDDPHWPRGDISASGEVFFRQSHPVFDWDVIWQSASYTGARPHRAPDTRYANGRMKIGECQSSGKSWQHYRFHPHDLIFVSYV
jgi:hypothetical protein